MQQFFNGVTRINRRLLLVLGCTVAVTLPLLGKVAHDSYAACAVASAYTALVELEL